MKLSVKSITAYTIINKPIACVTISTALNGLNNNTIPHINVINYIVSVATHFLLSSDFI